MYGFARKPSLITRALPFVGPNGVPHRLDVADLPVPTPSPAPLDEDPEDQAKIKTAESVAIAGVVFAGVGALTLIGSTQGLQLHLTF
jgi:hypothetical protein